MLTIQLNLIIDTISYNVLIDDVNCLFLMLLPFLIILILILKLMDMALKILK